MDFGGLVISVETVMVTTSLHCLCQGCSICNVVAKVLLGTAMSLNLNKMLLYAFNKTCCFIQVFVLFAMALSPSVCGNEAPQYYRSLLQNIISFIGLFCKRDLSF